VFRSVADLEAAIEAWITGRNGKPKPFKWMAKADPIPGQERPRPAAGNGGYQMNGSED
jgi:hypothetical protein